MTRSFIFHKIVIILCSVCVLASCETTPRIPKDYAGPDRGILVLSIAASDAAVATSYEVAFSDTEKGAVNEFTYIKADLNLAHKRDFDEGIVALASLPPGDYLFNTLSAYTSSAGFGDEGTTLDLDIPFSIMPNEVTYVGRLRAIESENSFGYEVSDASQTDLQVAFEKEASISTRKLKVQLQGISEYRDMAFSAAAPVAAVSSEPSVPVAAETEADIAAPKEALVESSAVIENESASETAAEESTSIATAAPAADAKASPVAPASIAEPVTQTTAETASTTPASITPAPVPSPSATTPAATLEEAIPEEKTPEEKTPESASSNTQSTAALSAPPASKPSSSNANEDEFEVKKGVRKSTGKYQDDVRSEIEKLKKERDESDSSRDFQFF